MPNYCANSLKMTAKSPEALQLLTDIMERIEGEDFALFDTIVPCPQELKDTNAGFPKDPKEISNLEKYGYAHWYDFNIAKWGTKWDAIELHILENYADTLIVNFDTAWAPPFGIYQALESKGFEVEATYCEAGCDFIGYWKDGTEHTESLSEVAPPPEDPETEDQYIEEYFDLGEYFETKGFDHSPPHFGG